MSNYPQLVLQISNKFSRDGRMITTRDTPSIPVFYVKTDAAGKKNLAPVLDGKDTDPQYRSGESEYETKYDEVYDSNGTPLGVNAYSEDIRKYRPAQFVTDPETGITYQRSAYGNIIPNINDAYKWVNATYPDLVSSLPSSGSATKLDNGQLPPIPNESKEATEKYWRAVNHYNEVLENIMARDQQNGIGGKIRRRRRQKRTTLRKRRTASKRRRNKSRRRK